MVKLNRRQAMKYGGAAIASMGAASMVPWGAFAADFPSTAFNLICPTGPGGGSDRGTRAVAPYFEQVVGQPYRPEFAPGAGGIVGATKIVGAPPDCYTLGFEAFSTANVTLKFSKPPNLDFGWYAPIGTLYGGPVALFVGKNSKFNTAEELLAASKKNPVRVAISRARTMYHISALIIANQLDAGFAYVPYGGGAPSRRAAISGEADAVVSGYFDSAANFSELRCLMVLGDKNPTPDLMPAPTMRQIFPKQAIDLYHTQGYLVSAAAAQAHPDRYRFLVEKYKIIHEMPETRAALGKVGFPPESLVYWGPEEIEGWTKTFQEKMDKISL